MDILLSQAWRKHLDAKTCGDALREFRIGLTAGRNFFPKEVAIKNREYLMSMNLSWFNPINMKHRKDIYLGPIVAFFNKGEINPDKIHKGEGSAGSEIALVKIAEILSERGYNVYIFHGGASNIHSIPCRKVQYLPISLEYENDLAGIGGKGFIRSFDSLVELGEVRVDHLILWRQRGDDNYVFNNYAKSVYLGCHDFCDVNLSCDLKAVVTLSQCHKEHFKIQRSCSNHIVGCNGVFLEQTEGEKRQPLKCCYASSYARGLSELLDMWPNIIEVYPSAELHIWYGRETFGVLNDEQMKAIVEKMQKQSTTVFEHGRIPHKDLAREMHKCDFMLYPYIGTSETFSISTATAMAGGCIPIVRKLHALAELVDIQEPELLTNEEFENYTIEMMGRRDQLEDYRKALQEKGRSYTWERATEAWEEAFKL